MDADEKQICNYLKGFPGQYISASEICRRASGKKRYREEPRWALMPLAHLVDKGIIEADADGHYRLKPQAKRKRVKRWVSPQVRQILEASGKDFDGVFNLDDTDEWGT